MDQNWLKLVNWLRSHITELCNYRQKEDAIACHVINKDFIPVRNVDFEMRVSSVDFEPIEKQTPCQLILDPNVGCRVKKQAMSGVGKYPFMGPKAPSEPC